MPRDWVAILHRIASYVDPLSGITETGEIEDGDFMSFSNLPKDLGLNKEEEASLDGLRDHLVDIAD